ncbi:MAG: hypothetical protein K8R79_09980, partial [Calditrichales bacterium]|nr:hypothetical protein [Calditrichales bacterium]
MRKIYFTPLNPRKYQGAKNNRNDYSILPFSHKSTNSLIQLFNLLPQGLPRSITPLLPFFQQFINSILPILHYSNIPALQFFNLLFFKDLKGLGKSLRSLPSLQHSITPCLPAGRTPILHLTQKAV